MSKRSIRELGVKKKIQQEDIDSVSEVDRIDETRFTKELSALIKNSEKMRIDYMRQHRMRNWIALNSSILFILLGSAAFGWYFMMEAKLMLGLAGLIASCIPPILLSVWAGLPIKTYKHSYKTVFMPQMAKALNGLSFYPQRGVSAKMIEKLAVIPAYDRYEAEDCFIGRYKGVKVIFSEARLYSKTHKKPVFDGIFTLLEVPEDLFEGHTIITANQKMIKAYENTRWKTMNPIKIDISNPQWDKFSIYSTEPENASKVIDERLIKELAEAGEIFDKSPLTAVLFNKRYIFMMIPYDKDMFEASNLFIPVTTRDQALRVKNEIEQLLEIADVFDLYQKQDSKQPA